MTRSVQRRSPSRPPGLAGLAGKVRGAWGAGLGAPVLGFLVLGSLVLGLLASGVLGVIGLLPGARSEDHPGSASSVIGLAAELDSAASTPAEGPRRHAGRSSSAEPWVLWAWQRPEDLGFLAGEPAGVAALVGTLRLRGPEVSILPRSEPLVIPAGALRTAVIRIESTPAAEPSLDQAQLRRAHQAVLDLLPPPDLDGFAAVQVDFDARVSERDFYRRLLVELSHSLGRGSGSAPRLEITALASWCLGDPWIAGLPIDEAVPMLFRMGAGEEPVRRRLAAGDDFTLELCRHSVGISTD
ncbi:MAG: hypothetical protein MI919_33275, partial [Holophagales bacterium]|nr:hypothetical protein [Holophagales bacterium]